ncbi:PaaI family thioesterase [Blastochloris sulfoviridis]|nr:PaaI family thioesterase [Blastochloris sulfoviridis]
MQLPTTAETAAPDAAPRARMTTAELQAFLRREFPQSFEDDGDLVVEATGYGFARVRLKHAEKHLRPGDTLSGPSMMLLADATVYVALLASIGPVPLAVTINLNINFLRKPTRRDLIAECRLIKLGKRLAVGDIGIRSDGRDELVAHATATYSIPDK